MNQFPQIPSEFIYALIAISGGVARYLNSLTSGNPFSVFMLAASAFMSGFSGYMFYLAGVSMNLPSPILGVMAGVGGFFGDQTMKFLMEYVQKKLQ